MKLLPSQEPSLSRMMELTPPGGFFLTRRKDSSVTSWASKKGFRVTTHRTRMLIPDSDRLTDILIVRRLDDSDNPQ